MFITGGYFQGGSLTNRIPVRSAMPIWKTAFLCLRELSEKTISKVGSEIRRFSSAVIAGLESCDKKALLNCYDDVAYIGARRCIWAHGGKQCLKASLPQWAIDTSIVSQPVSMQNRAGCKLPLCRWIYCTVREKAALGGTEEAEIVQWGGIPKERIVGFVHTGKFAPEGPIFIRKARKMNQKRSRKCLIL